VSVTIPAGKVTDISGNENLASNQLDIKHCMNISFPSILFLMINGHYITLPFLFFKIKCEMLTKTSMNDTENG